MTSLTRIYRQLSDDLDALSFSPPVAYVYNPLNYAWEVHRTYLERFGSGRKQAIFLGMNPGPFGMAQTGVPFGAREMVQEWMGLSGAVGKPPVEHPERQIVGFDVVREEVSGTRLWGWIRDRFDTPERFFEHYWVANYCPLVFMEASARNLTPDKLPAAERQPVLDLCDRALAEVVKSTGAERIIGVGKFAQDRARAACAGIDLQIDRILHPSPASPAANRGWAEQADRQIAEIGVPFP